MIRFHQIGSAVFLLSGRFKRQMFTEDRDGGVNIRLLYRFAHIYILFAALLNGLFNISCPLCSRWCKWRQRLSSSALGMGPVLFLVAFIYVPQVDELRRTLTLPGVALSLPGTFLAVVSSQSADRKTGDSRAED